MRRSVRVTSAAWGTVGFLLVTSACTAAETPPPTAPPPIVSPNPTSGLAGPTAAESKAAFDQAAQGIIASTPAPSLQAFIDALVAVGFDRARMQSTSEVTTQGKPVDAVFWAVEFPDGCLIGQYRPVEPDPEDDSPGKLVPYVSTSAPPTATGCLLGAVPVAAG